MAEYKCNKCCKTKDESEFALDMFECNSCMSAKINLSQDITKKDALFYIENNFERLELIIDLLKDNVITHKEILKCVEEHKNLYKNDMINVIDYIQDKG